MMIRRNRIYIWLVAIWLLMLGGAMSPVQAYPQAQQPAAWRTQPVMSNELYPQYHFQSTSAYKPVVGHTSYTVSEPYNPFQASSPKRVRRVYNPWDEDPDDDDENNHPVGEVDNPAPIGSPLILLVMALLYFGYLYFQKRRSVE